MRGTRVCSDNLLVIYTKKEAIFSIVFLKNIFDIDIDSNVLCNINSGLIILVLTSSSIIINNMLRKGEELLRKLAMLSISRFSMSIGYPHSQ